MTDDDPVERTSGLGGGDIAQIVGLSPYGSAFDVWLRKTGRAPEIEVTEAMEWGHRAEPIIADKYEEVTGKKLIRHFTKGFRHPGRAFQIGHPDGLTEDHIVYESKNPGGYVAHRYGEPGTDEVPEWDLLQVQWYLSLFGADEGHLAALIGGNKFRIYKILRDHETEDMLLSRASFFWAKNVQADVPPPITDTELSREWLRRKYPVHTQPVRPANLDEKLLASLHQIAKQRLAEYEEEAANYEIALKASIGDAAGIEGDGWRISYRAAKSGGTDWKGLALSLHPTQEAIAEFARPGSRRFLATYKGEVIHE